MANTIATDESGNIIAVSSTGIVSDDSATALHDAAADRTSGDALPANLAEMVGGTFVSGVYTAPAAGPDWADRERAFEEAQLDWIENGGMADDAKWKRCVKSNCLKHLEDADWTLVIAAYPAA